MSFSLTHGVVALIPTRNKPRIFFKKIGDRFLCLMCLIKSHQQIGFTSGRYVVESSRTSYDMLCLQEDQIPGFLFAIDSEKAFDSISLRFMTNVLQFWIFSYSRLDTFCEGATSVLVNGFIFKVFL